MRKPHLVLFFGSAALLLFAPRCSSSPQDCTQTSTCPQEGGDGPPPLVCDMSKDPKDDTGCIDDRVGVFVSPSGSDSNAGTKAAPFQTIGKALASVGSLTRVYVCEGTYAEDVAIAPPADGVSIYGGFKCSDWSYSGNKPTIGKGAVALKISGTTKPFTIEDVLVKAADGDATNPSSVAAFVANASGAVTFSRVNLTAGKGASGGDGAAGNNYNDSLAQSDPSIAGHSASGISGGGVQTCGGLCADSVASTGGSGGTGGASPGDGSGGAPALGGGGKGTGDPDQGGAGTCSNGGPGNNAMPAGGDAASPTSTGVLDEAGWHPGAGAKGTNGTPGQGGGGGGGGYVAANTSGGGGGGGCGGCGGGGGSAGGGGGASIALAVVSSPVNVSASELHAVDAGSGGKGGAGQVGQSGGFAGVQTSPGCPGGNGGNGSAGGSGSGGPGGLSVGILYKGTAPTVDAGTTAAITVGNAGAKGTGGTAGTNDGIDGAAQQMMQAP